jgi:hypothetical protein
MPISNRLVYPRTHRFHIPVMGTGHSIDTPLRVAPWGISSVISLVDDVLIEQVHRLHAQRLGTAFQPVDPREPKARALRIRNYLDFLHEKVQARLDSIRSQDFSAGSEKTKWFRMLPETSPLKAAWKALDAHPSGSEARVRAEAELTSRMEAGSIDANIMTKLDRRAVRDGAQVEARLSDAKLALEGFALSRNDGNLVFSAGINPTLYGTIEEFPSFYRQGAEEARHGIVIKVSDFRSALTQGKFLAKKGLEVREYRIESGLNCGGHAFASDGELLGPIVDEFRQNRHRLGEEYSAVIAGWYRRKGLDVPPGTESHQPAVTVQGGVGNSAEQSRFLAGFGMDSVGWGSPFLLVPEAAPVDRRTRELLASSRPGDIFLSPSSPLGVPFNNLRGSSAQAELWRKFDEGRPGSGCPKGFLVSNTEFTDHPVCTASRGYQERKIAEEGGIASPSARVVAQKECICHQLGNGALEFIRSESARLEGRERTESDAPVSVCPGPNIAWFDREYGLEEMIDHIHGRIPSLVPSHRPHTFAAELSMYLDHLDSLRASTHPENAKDVEKLDTFRVNLAASLAWYRGWLATASALPGENIASLREEVERAEEVLLGVEAEAAVQA